LDYSILTENFYESCSVYILKFIIQPLVENSIYHGIKDSKKRGNINIIVKDIDIDNYSIIVEDTGKGIEKEKLMALKTSFESSENDKTIGFGLSSVVRRLKLCYGRTSTFEITSTYQKGTRVTINLPKHLEGVP
jgi:sensor histidine kinase YesM